MKVDDDIIRYLVSKEFIGRLGYYFFLNYYSEEQIPDSTFDFLPIFATKVDIKYNDELTMEPKRFKEGDFYKSNITDLTTFFQLLWGLLSYSVAPNRENHEEYLYHKSGVDYVLTPLENKIFSLEKEQIFEMFEAISLDNKKARTLISKIVGYANFESIENSKTTLGYITEELKDDTANKRYAEYFCLITVLLELGDQLHERRVR